MFEIVFLGTSASAPSVRRGLSAQVVIHNEYRFLIDCGEGTQRQILQSGLGFKRLNRSLDHPRAPRPHPGLGGADLHLLPLGDDRRAGDLRRPWALDRIRELIFGVVLRGAEPPMSLHSARDPARSDLRDDDFSVSAFPVWHRGPDCFGFLFEEKERRPFLPEKAEALNIPPGPWRRDLVNGQVVTLPDGRTVQPEEVLGPVREGIRLVHVGDVGRTQDLEVVCQNADALVIEATYLDEEVDMADQFAHLTARRAAELAVRVGVKHLILTHISRRYRERDVLAEAQAIFPAAVVARDFDIYQVKRGEFARVESTTEPD